ncbi:Uncharacterised protein [Bordetella pertussis]|nr:Uncharacterised protein [Bordetella pertussis]
MNPKPRRRRRSGTNGSWPDQALPISVFVLWPR